MDEIIKIIVLFTSLMWVREITCSATNVSISTSILDPATTPYPATMKFTNATIIGTTATSLVSNTVSTVSSNSTQFTSTFGITEPTNATIIGTTATSLVSNTVFTVSSNSTQFTSTFIRITEPTNASIIGTTATSLVSNTVSTVSSDSTKFTPTFGIAAPNAPAAPSLSPGSNATNTIVVSWTAPTGGNDIVNYVVEWTTNSATTTQLATGNSTTLTSLTPGELYSVNVKARNSAGAEAQSNNTWHRTNPNPPASFSVNTITANNEITFSFTAPVTPNVFSYYTLTTNANGTTNTTIISASDTAYTFTGGQPNTIHVFHLKAVSGTFVFQTESTAISVMVRTFPDKVTAVSNSSVATTNTIKLTWSAVIGLVRYRVSWSSVSHGGNQTVSGTTATIDNLIASTRYTFDVVALNADGGSGVLSDPVLFSTLPNAPAAPSLSTGSDATNTIVVSWTAPTGGNDIVDYVVEWTANSTSTTRVATGNSTTLTSLTPGELYSVNVKARNSAGAGAQSNTTLYRTNPVITCPSQCEGCMGPCSLSSTGGCGCSCINGYFPTQVDCQPVVCKEETLVHPTLLINVMFPILQAGFQSSSLETCGSETVNSGKPYGTRSCLLNGTSTTPIWLTSCDRGIQNIANVTITSIEERVAVANDLEVLTSNPESLSSDDVTNTVQALDIVLNVPSITPQVSLSAVAVVSNMLNVPDDVFVASTGTERLLAAIESVGTKVELDENGVYEAVTSNVGIAAIQHAVSADLVRTSFGIDNLPTNSNLGFRSDQVHLFGSGSPDNVTGSISVPNSAASTNFGTPERISFLAFSNDKLFISSNGTYDDVNSVVVLSAAIGQTSVTNLVDPVVVQLMTNVTLNNGSDGRSPSCVFWDEVIQSWTNGDVDSKVEETSDSVVCHFNHLTNFATLLARDGTGIVNTKALDIVSIVGSSISSFCLLLTILSFICVPKLRIGGRLRGTVLLVNLSMALLLLNLLLIFSEQSFVYSSPDSCLAVGVLLHFSLLASFAWMNVEAVNLCLVIITPLYNRTHVNEKTVFILSHIWGWFVPSLFVAITCAVDLNLYRRGDHDRECWMQTHVVLYLVLIPMIIVLTFNFIAYVAVLVASVSANRVRKSRANSGSQRRQAVMSVSLFVLFGLTWIFGFGIMGNGYSAVVFGYIFAVLNSLQGFFIFCLFIVRNKTARKEIQSHITTRSPGTQQSTGNTKLQRPIETSFRASTGSFKSGHSDAKLSTQVLQTSLDKITRGPRAHYNPTSTRDSTISSQVFSDI